MVKESLDNKKDANKALRERSFSFYKDVFEEYGFTKDNHGIQHHLGGIIIMRKDINSGRAWLLLSNDETGIYTLLFADNTKHVFESVLIAYDLYEAPRDFALTDVALRKLIEILMKDNAKKVLDRIRERNDEQEFIIKRLLELGGFNVNTADENYVSVRMINYDNPAYNRVQIEEELQSYIQRVGFLKYHSLKASCGNIEIQPKSWTL